MMPFHTNDFPAALAFARREAYRLHKPSAVLVDTGRACLYVLPGFHRDFVEGREVVVTVTPEGKELIGAQE